MAKESPIIPIAGGAAGALLAVTAADKLGANPTWAAWGTAAAGAATALGTKGLVRQVAMGVGAAGVCLGAIQLISAGKAEKAKKEAQAQNQKRQADANLPYVTRQELNDALTHLAEQQKQGSCDLLTSLRDEIKKVVADTSPRRAAGAEDDYVRNAYGDDERNAVVEDEYMRNAYGDEDVRNASFDDERNAGYDDERNAARFGGGDRRVTYAQPVGVRMVPQDVDGAAYDDAEYYDERNAYGDDERNAFVDDERNAVVEEVSAAA